MNWTQQLHKVCFNYLRERLFLLALVTILFIMGLIFGSIAAGVLDSIQRTELANYIQQGLHGDISPQDNGYTRQIIIANVQTVFFLFFMGISVIGVPLALLLIFTRGFILGFSGGFLFQTMGLKGAAIMMVGILPHNLLAIPALFLMVIAITDCAVALAKIRFTRNQVPIRDELIQCAILTFIVLVGMVLAGWIQGSVTPVITSWLARMI